MGSCDSLHIDNALCFAPQRYGFLHASAIYRGLELGITGKTHRAFLHGEAFAAIQQPIIPPVVLGSLISRLLGKLYSDFLIRLAALPARSGQRRGRLCFEPTVKPIHRNYLAFADTDAGEPLALGKLIGFSF